MAGKTNRDLILRLQDQDLLSVTEHVGMEGAAGAGGTQNKQNDLIGKRQMARQLEIIGNQDSQWRKNT